MVHTQWWWEVSGAIKDGKVQSSECWNGLTLLYIPPLNTAGNHMVVRSEACEEKGGA